MPTYCWNHTQCHTIFACPKCDVKNTDDLKQEIVYLEKSKVDLSRRLKFQKYATKFSLALTIPFSFIFKPVIEKVEIVLWGGSPSDVVAAKTRPDFEGQLPRMTSRALQTIDNFSPERTMNVSAFVECSSGNCPDSNLTMGVVEAQEHLLNGARESVRPTRISNNMIMFAGSYRIKTAKYKVVFINSSTDQDVVARVYITTHFP